MQIDNVTIHDTHVSKWLTVTQILAISSNIGAAKVSMIGAVGPVATIFFGWLFLGEDVTVLQIIGAFQSRAVAW